MIQKEDSSTFDVNYKFGSHLNILPTGEEMQEEEEDDRKDVTPGKRLGKKREMRCKPIMMKDAVRLTRNDRLSQERSPGGGGRVMKKKRCTPRKITKISHVSTMKHLFENASTSSLTRGGVELLQQPSQGFNLPGATTTTTRDARNGRKDCVSESDALIQTGPRQTVKLDFGVGQDWRKQARLEGGEPMGDEMHHRVGTGV